MSIRSVSRRCLLFSFLTLTAPFAGCDLNETATELAVETWYVPPGQKSQAVKKGGGSATGEPVRFTVELSTLGEGTGRIVGSKYGIRCGRGETSQSCVVVIQSGEILNLKAEPTGSTNFVGWGGDCAVAKNASYCDLRVTKNMVISASMERRSCESGGTCGESP